MGNATAKLLAKEGHAIYGVYNTHAEEAQMLAKEFENVKVLRCDFAERKNTLQLIEGLEGVMFSGIVNCAGVFLTTDFRDFDINVWDETMEINLNTPLLLVHGLRNQLEEEASIVNISSTDGMVGSISGMAYAASKAALINLTQSLANVLADKKIRVNAIAPGWIGDGMQAPSELLKEVANINPLKRTGTYEEIAQVVEFLLSEKSSYVNGVTITVDGGDSATNYILQKEAEME